MALIRCPKCETLHDMEASLFGGQPRRVRCASCREVWEATLPTLSNTPSISMPTRYETVQAPEPEPETVAPDFDFDALDIDPAADAKAGSVNADPFDIEAEFSAVAKPEASPEPELIRLAEPEPVQEIAPAQEPEFQPRANRRNGPQKPIPAKPKAAGSARAVLMAATIGTLAALGLFRHEVVRLVPATAVAFEAVGLKVNTRGLEIDGVRSRMVREGNTDMLEVVGTVANLTRQRQSVPVLRLALRNAAGQEIYVWTAAPEQTELEPGEKGSFRRRLASPPADAHSVMVRFVAKDDIVASIQ